MMRGREAKEAIMAKPFRDWTVLPHGELVRLDTNLFCVDGLIHLPTGDFERRMTVVRLASTGLVIYSAIALSEAQMHMLESFGTPTYLVVPSALHRMDARIWKDRYPALLVVAPAGARE